MTAPKKKTATKAKPKTAAKKKPAAPKSTAEPEVQPEVAKPPKVPAYLDKDPADYKVGTEIYAEVVKAFNKKYLRQYNPHRVPPFIFKNMLSKLREAYGLK